MSSTAILNIQKKPQIKQFGTVFITDIQNPFNALDFKRSVDIHGRTLGEYIPPYNDFIVALNGKITTDYTQIVPENSVIIISPVIAGGGGGKNPLKIIASLVVAVFTAGISSGAIFGAGGWTSLAGSGFFGIGTAAGWMSGIVGVVGMALVNAIFPAQQPDIPSLDNLKSESPTYNWTGIKSSRDINKPIPVLYGTHMIGGNVINEFVDYDGQEEWLHSQIALCHGTVNPITESDVFVNNRGFGEFQGTSSDLTAKIQSRVGTFDQGIMSGFDDSSFNNVINAKCEYNVYEEVRTVSTNIDKLKVHIAFANGLFNVNQKSGSLTNNTVKFWIEYKKTSSSTWNRIGNPLPVYNYTYRYKTTIQSSLEPSYGYTLNQIESGMVNSFSVSGSYAYFTLSDYNDLTTNFLANRTVYIAYKLVPSGTFGGYIKEKYKDYLTYASLQSEMSNIKAVYSYSINHLDNSEQRSISYYTATYNNEIYQVYPVTAQYISRTLDPNLTTYYYDISVTAATRNPLKKIYEVDNLDQGQYDVRVIRKTAEESANSTTSNSDMTLSIIEEIQTADINYGGIALVGIDIKATDQISGGQPAYKTLVSRTNLTLQNQSGSFTVSSNNPAWVIYDILTNPYYGYGKSYTSIDYDKFLEWANWCDSMGENGLTFNGVIDVQTNVWDAIQNVAKIGRGQIILRGNKYSCMYDAPSDMVQMFTDANINMDSLKVSYIGINDIASEVEIQFSNKDIDYEMDSIVVRDNQLYSSQLRPNKQQITMLGITDPSDAIAMGRYLLANNKYIKRTAEFTASIDAIACTVGDVVGLSSDVVKWGTGGHIDSVINATDIKLDKQINFVPNITYILRIRNKQTDEITAYNFSVDEDIITDIVSINDTTGINSDDIYAISEDGNDILKFRIVEISRDSDLNRKIKAVEYNESILDYDYSNDIVQQIFPLQKSKPILSNLEISDNLVIKSDGTIGTEVRIDWDIEFSQNDLFTIQYKESNARRWNTLVGRLTSTDYIFMSSLVEGLNYDFRVMIDDFNYISKTHYLAGKTTPPPKIENLTYTESGNNFYLSWEYEDKPLDFKEFEIYLDNSFIGKSINNTFTYYSNGLNKKQFKVRAVDTSSNYSEFVYIDCYAQKPPKIENLTYSLDCDEITLSWDYEDKPLDFKHFEVRLNNISISNVTTNSTTVPLRGQSNYYAVFAVDTSNNYSDIVNIKTEVQYLENVEDFNTYFNKNGEIELTWSLIQSDCSPVSYEIRKGESWSNSIFVANVYDKFFKPNGNGNYLVKAKHINIYGFTNYSSSAASLEITGDNFVRNVIASYSEKADWAGTKENLLIYEDDIVGKSIALIPANNDFDSIVNVDSIANIDYINGCVLSGVYYLPDSHNITLDQSARLGIEFNYSTYAIDIENNFDLIDDVDLVVNIDGDYSSAIKVTPQIKIDSGDWKKFIQGDYVGQSFEFRLLIETNNQNIIPVVHECTLVSDVPDKILQGTNININGLTTVNYPSSFNTDEVNLQVTILNSSDGDYAIISNENRHSFDIEIKNGASSVSRNINWVAQAY